MSLTWRKCELGTDRSAGIMQMIRGAQKRKLTSPSTKEGLPPIFFLIDNLNIEVMVQGVH